VLVHIEKDTARFVTAGECYDVSILGQGRWRGEIKVFVLKTNDEKM
jgi:hypothetical protein